MEDNFLPSFVKRKGRITKYQIDNLKDIEKAKSYIKSKKGKTLTNFEIISKLESIKHKLMKIKSEI